MSGMGLMANKSFWNQLLEKAFLALIAWFMLSLVQDVRILNSSLQQLNEKMAVVINEIANQKQALKDMKSDIDYLNKNAVIRR